MIPQQFVMVLQELAVKPPTERKPSQISNLVCLPIPSFLNFLAIQIKLDPSQVWYHSTPLKIGNRMSFHSSQIETVKEIWLSEVKSDFLNFLNRFDIF